MRGTEMGRCPVGTLAEILTFLSWSIAGTYFLLNLVYRSNALALFSISVATLIQFIVLFLPRTAPSVEQWLKSSWLPMHVVFAILGYAAFGVAAILAAMYLRKDRQLKAHHLTQDTMTFPAVTNLELWMTRILFAGFVLFTAGLVAGFLWYDNLEPAKRVYDYKICWTLTVWLAYFGLLLSHRFQWLRRRSAAWICVILTTATFLSFWGINSISAYHNF
jgi:ABC-type uncharacterized transport system permease subunit